jgi:hypothetical protein
MIDRIQYWITLRKKTTPVHWGMGILCGLFSALFFWAGFALILLFAVDEWWDDKNHKTKQGNNDWWEAYSVYMGALGVVWILNAIGAISTRWI